MRVLLLHLDGAMPNLALMRIAAHHRERGDEVELRRTGKPDATLFDLLAFPNKVYASAIFEKTRPVVQRALDAFPTAVVGGTGVAGYGELPPMRPDMVGTLDDRGITTRQVDYSVYPGFRQSIGFTQRGCRLGCAFCVVRRKEGRVTAEGAIADIWRGDPWPREIVLLDNDFFGEPSWRDRIAEIRDGGFKVSFNQGINARFLSDEAAEAIASVDYRDGKMNARRIYTAWDNQKDEQRLFDGLKRLVKCGVKPDHVMVYVLIGFDHATKSARPTLCDDDFHRVAELRAFGARPYPMPFVRTRELVGFQRWCVGAYDKRIKWSDWQDADYEPRKLGCGEAVSA
jgi:hypothetical protein